ncbi:MAG: winged helix-turn-helix domain-containing protein [Lachnospiraceae bacterium]|nr:winged helix-turn-helix domain-containing protein [Lachnospiraceae bacterium]
MEQILERKSLHILSGKVIHGRGIGKLVGMPTANMEVPDESILPPVGVYIADILLDGQIYYGITNIGTRPTVDNDKEMSVETHILNFSREIYGKELKIQLFSKLRSQQRFENFSMLLDQIRKDCIVAREYFGIEEIAYRLYMNAPKHQVIVDDQEIYLSAKEFDILYMLYSNPNIAYTKDQIYEAVWHEPSNGCCHAVENTIFQIRKRIKECSGEHDFIKTVIGFGYKFNMV